VNGVLYGFDDTCTHRRCSLADGDLDGAVVTCPCHAGEFDVRTGEVLSGPPPEPVLTYAVRESGNAVEIELV
jgi:nitrite reductase/ring-hydroxylating ferredoxin subunit